MRGTGRGDGVAGRGGGGGHCDERLVQRGDPLERLGLYSPSLKRNIELCVAR